MQIFRFIQIIFLIVFGIDQFKVTIASERNVLQILLMEYEKNPYKWENRLQDFTAIILNEELVVAMNDHNIPSIQQLYNEAITKMYIKLPANVLVEQLWKIYRKYDVKSFITMVRAQLGLYKRHQLDKQQDPYYILMAANCFYKIKTDAFYERLDKSLRALVESFIKSLPSSLQYLFGKQEFCLLNKMHSEMIYQSINHPINIDTHHVFTWAFVKNFSDYMGVIVPIFEETSENSLSNLNVILSSKHFNGYYYRLPEYEHKICANTTEHGLKNLLWNIEYVNDDQLVFKQDDYIMCGISSYSDENGYVYGLTNRTIYDTECQWSAGECDRRESGKF